MQLLQASWSEILTFSLCFRSLPKSNSRLCFAPDFSITEQEANNCGLSQFFNHVSIEITDSDLGFQESNYIFNVCGLVYTFDQPTGLFRGEKRGVFVLESDSDLQWRRQD